MHKALQFIRYCLLTHLPTCPESLNFEWIGCDWPQGPARGWGVALATHGFSRGSGIHRWRVRLDSVNRRGHVFLGVATRQTALGSYLGADRHGWGYLVSQDLYHGGSRLRSGYGARMSAGMTVELTLNTDIGLLSVGNADTGEDFGPAMNNLYEDVGGLAGAGISLGGGRDARIEPRGGGAGATSLSAAAAATLAASFRGGGGGGGGADSQPATLWPAFAMHQPGDSVTFLPRTGSDSYAAPRPLAGGIAGAAAAAGYRSLQSLVGGGSGGPGGSFGGIMSSGGAGEGAFATQALPLGYPDPLLVDHACTALKMAAGVLREAGKCGGEEDAADGGGVVAR